MIDRDQGTTTDQLENIFKRFTRAKRLCFLRGESSTVLGLSIVKMLMDAMGGEVSVHSKVGEDSIFSLHLLHQITPNGQDSILSLTEVISPNNQRSTPEH